MADVTNIEWADSTQNFWEGCTKVGPGCEHCYAENRNARWAGGESVNWGPGAPRRRTSAATWNKPLLWQRQAEAFFAQRGRRRRVFCASLSDVFDNEVEQAWRNDAWKIIEDTPDLDWLLLTKRIGNARNMVPWSWLESPLPNVIFGATVVTQAEWDRDVPKLIEMPALRRFVSIEPMLEHIDMRGLKGIDWVIMGGMSGPGATPLHPGWIRSGRGQCAIAGVPFLFKQWGEWAPVAGRELAPGDVLVMNWPEGMDGFVRSGTFMRRIGKKAAGRMLDGHTYTEFPA